MSSNAELLDIMKKLMTQQKRLMAQKQKMAHQQQRITAQMERVARRDEDQSFLPQKKSTILSPGQKVDKTCFHQRVEGQSHIDSSVGRCTGESRQLRRQDKFNLALE